MKIVLIWTCIKLLNGKTKRGSKTSTHFRAPYNLSFRVELSATPPRYAHYKRILEIIRFGAFHPSEYTDHELAILMSISASKSINISANERRAFASELFELVSTTHGIDVWNAKIKADIDNGEKIDVMQMLEELSKRELEPTLKTYELVTEIYANEGKFYEIT